MKPPQPHEDEDAYRVRLKMETLQEATVLLDQGAASSLYEARGQEQANYLIQLAALMDAVAQRLADEGVTWADLAYMGEAAVGSDLFDNTSYELLSHVLSESVNQRYLTARRTLASHIEQRETQVRLSRPTGTDAWTIDEEPPY